MDKKSLRSRTNKIVRAKHAGLFKGRWGNALDTLKHNLSSSHSWKYVTLIVLLLLIGSIFIDIGILDIIPFSSDSAQKIVDQRASNIATIMSITLVVVGFLMNNIAVKESFSYQLLFENSFFYPIIYLVLSTIGYFFIVSVMRESVSSFHFARLVLVGTYLALFILFVIGYLFRKIIQFTNGENVMILLHEKVMNEARALMINTLFTTYSSTIYEKELTKAGCTEYTIAEALGSIDLSSMGFSEAPSMEEVGVVLENMSLHDIDLNAAISFAKTNETNGRIYFKKLTLDKSIVNAEEEYLWVKGRNNTKEEKHKLRKGLILKRVSFSSKDLNSREYLDQKMAEWSTDGKSKRLEQLLRTYRDLYELEMNNQPQEIYV